MIIPILGTPRKDGDPKTRMKTLLECAKCLEALACNMRNEAKALQRELRREAQKR